MRRALFVFSVTLIAAVTSCRKSTDPATADYWLDKLESRAERPEALRELGKMGDKKALPQVMKLFKQEGTWQPEAAYAVGQLGDASVVPELVAAISPAGSGSDPATRQKNRLNASIARALGLLRAKEAAPEIVKLSKSGESKVREAAIGALGLIGGDSATPTLTEITMNDPDPYIREIAIVALGEQGDAKAVPTLVQMLYVEIPGAGFGVSFYEHARLALVQVGRASVPELIKTLKRENSAVEAIRMQDGGPIAEGAIEAKAGSTLSLLRAAEAEDLIVGALAKLYERLKQSPNSGTLPGAVIELAYAVGNYGGSKAARVLLPLAKDSDPNIRLAACEALTSVGDASVAKDLIEVAKSGDDNARRAAVVAVSRLGGAEEIPAFDALAAQSATMAAVIKSERVRLLAAQECKKDAACWSKKLKDADAKVRERAAYELGYGGVKTALNDLLIAAEDADAEVRLAAVLSLGRIGGADPEKLKTIYEQWHTKLEYRGVNQELQRVIAHAKGLTHK